MKINLIILLLLIAIAGGWSIWQSQKNKPSAFQPKEISYTSEKEVIENIDFNLISGDTMSLYDIKDKTIIIHFWATWCAPCVVEFPELIRLANETKDNVVILAVSTNDKKEDIDRFLKKLSLEPPMNFIIAHDPNKKITQDFFKTIKLPESFILTPKYQLHKKIVGASDEWVSKEKIDYLRGLSLSSSKTSE